MRYVSGAWTCTAIGCASGCGRAARQRQPRVHASRSAAAIPERLRLYWIQDNLSANWTPDIRAYADDNNIELVPTPTYASYLNRIECTSCPISEFVVKNADYLDWDAFAPRPRPTTSPTATARTATSATTSSRRQIAA